LTVEYLVFGLRILFFKTSSLYILNIRLEDMKILKTGAIYRLTYTGWKTTPQPIVFILYAGPQGNKMHGLYLNSSTNSKAEFVRFISIIKQLSNSNSIYLKNSRALYTILKKYCPNFMRTAYRTLFKDKIGNYAVVSYGLAKETDFSEQEKIKNDYLLYSQGKKMFQSVVVNNIMPEKKVVDTFYQPVKAPPPPPPQKVQIKNETTGVVKTNISKDNKPEGTVRKTSANYQEPKTAGDEIEGY